MSVCGASGPLLLKSCVCAQFYVEIVGLEYVQLLSRMVVQQVFYMYNSLYV